ncbi:VC0807 family protein [Streptacidiphilus neutrinimicus]|uniref:VC0807 family protein n=1 Tax=Streptacidiphilus neutrinimicus TaxID=105420 RepID=UPI0006937CEE|nr:VC0807 family protein [Streptacidiphilus neutrinimicus]
MRARQAIRLVLDFVVPTAMFYVLRAAGVGLYLTLVLSAVLPAGVAVWRWSRSRERDGLALYMLSMLVFSALVSLISGSPRFLLAREGWVTGVTGIWFIASVWASRPLAFHYTRPMLEGRRLADIPGDWDDLWERLPRFRRVWKVGSALWGIALLADSVVRVIMAYTLPVNAVPALGTALYLVTSVVLIVITNVYYITTGLYDRRSRLYAPLREQGVLPGPAEGPQATASG